jgi:D-alanyl-D-alanine dipeptidase
MEVVTERLRVVGVMAEIVLLSDARVAAVPVAECGEPLVDLRTVAPLRVDHRQADPAGAYAHVRAGVVDRLVTAQSLLRRGLRLLIIEAHRPLALQERYFSERVEHLRDIHPDWPADRLFHEASRYISPPHVAPHVSGGAVDLTLTDSDGAELAMGCPVNADSDSSNGRCYTHATNVPPEAGTNRRTLATVLEAAGFVNYPTEWWHWSYGDRYWAFTTGVAAARYSPVGLRAPD